MLNKDKVKYMTKAAAYEKGAERKNIEISGYYRADYLGLQMIKSAVAYVLAFLVCLIMWGMTRLEELMLMVSHAEYLQGLVRILVLLFVSGLAVYEILVYVYFSKRYYLARNSVKKYYGHLKNIHRQYDIQEASERESEKQNISEDEGNTI